MSLASTKPAPFRPPAPKPRKAPIGASGDGLRAVAQPARGLDARAFRTADPRSAPPSWAMRAVVSDPAAVRRIFLDNAANYRKDALQLRVLRPVSAPGC